jgi:hypothetical protein
VLELPRVQFGLLRIRLQILKMKETAALAVEMAKNFWGFVRSLLDVILW